MSAADLLRQALADAPDGLHVRHSHGYLQMLDDARQPAANTFPREQAMLRLVGLLLAAAPHLVDLLELPPNGPSASRMADLLGKIDAAIRAIGEQP